MRTLTNARVNSLALADNYMPLPNHIKRMDLLDALEISKTHFELTDAELLYLRLAFRNTPETSWHCKKKEPIFGWGKIDSARALGKTERTVSRIENGLVEKGFIAHRDGPQFRRYAIQCEDKRYAAGVSLAPIGTRHAEILAISEQIKQDQKSWYRARKDLYALKNQIISALDKITGEILEKANSLLDRIPDRLDSTFDLTHLIKLVQSAKTLLKPILQHMSSQQDKNDRPKHKPDNYPDIPASKPKTHFEDGHDHLLQALEKAPPDLVNLIETSDQPNPMKRLRSAIVEYGKILSITEAQGTMLARKYPASQHLEALYTLNHALEQRRDIKSPIAFVTYLLGKRSRQNPILTKHQKWPTN